MAKLEFKPLELTTDQLFDNEHLVSVFGEEAASRLVQVRTAFLGAAWATEEAMRTVARQMLETPFTPNGMSMAQALVNSKRPLKEALALA